MDGIDAVIDTSHRRRHGSEINICPACYHRQLKQFYEVRGVPANSCILFSSEADARSCPTSDIRLALCEACGFIVNTSFDKVKTEYSGRYEETQAFSETFNKFHMDIARSLVERHDLRGKDIVEIGCGKGEFLTLLAEIGGNRCLGIDPGVHAGRLKEAQRGSVDCIADYYSEKYTHKKVDFLVCKMTLEHIVEAEQFVSTVRRGLGDKSKAIVFFQIPESLRILRECAFEDVYHEHCAYFTPGSIGRLFRRCGFEVMNVEVEYGDQYLMIEARPSARAMNTSTALEIEGDADEVADLVATFPVRMESKLTQWRSVVRDAAVDGKTVAIWGSGSKAVAFLKSVDVEASIRYVTDVNPYRHNHYMPLSGQRIIPPAELKAIRPDIVIAMNRIYHDEIRCALHAMGLSSDLRCL